MYYLNFKFIAILYHENVLIKNQLFILDGMERSELAFLSWVTLVVSEPENFDLDYMGAMCSMKLLEPISCYDLWQPLTIDSLKSCKMVNN